MDKKKEKGSKPIKKVKKSKKAKDEELAAKEAAAKKAMFEEIMEKTGLTEDEVNTAYKNFMNDYPSEEITMQEFIEQSDVGFLSESLFKGFDKENMGRLRFKDYMLASNVTMSSPEDKLEWIFTAFDKDGGGTIDSGEIRDIVEALFQMANIDDDEDLIVACVTDINKAVDADGDGEITQEEFVKNALKSRFLKNMLKN